MLQPTNFSTVWEVAMHRVIDDFTNLPGPFFGVNLIVSPVLELYQIWEGHRPITALPVKHFYRAACNADASSDENSVRLSVKRVICDKGKKDLSRFLYHTKDHLA